LSSDALRAPVAVLRASTTLRGPRLASISSEILFFGGGEVEVEVAEAWAWRACLATCVGVSLMATIGNSLIQQTDRRGSDG
jgi:hypothetical protein